MPKAQPPLKRGADVFGQGDLPRRIAGDLRRRRMDRQESRGAAGAWIEGGARDLSPIVDAAVPGQIQRASWNEVVEVGHHAIIRVCPTVGSLATAEAAHGRFLAELLWGA